LFELFDEEGWWFFTMEYVDGVDFLEHVRNVKADDVAAEETIETSARDAGLVAPSSPTAMPLARSALDENKLRTSLAQLVRALLVLHAAGKVHRDVKPSNVLVDALADRVVVLDFGLVLDLGRGGHELHVTQADEVVGTVGYMAPEQAAARTVGPPADWYSVGVILYRALTGRLPFRGLSHEVLADKRAYDPPPPRSVVTGVPADLDALCMEMLRIDPSRRPLGIDILRRISANAAPELAMPSIPPPRAPPFVGRDRELAVLDDAFQATREGQAITVCIVGESGLGKSALARRFGDRVAHDYGAIVLTGRCHERESVRFKGVDGVIDALARHLVKVPKAEAAALLPRRAALLPQAFPVLKRVEVIAEAPMPLHDVRDPKELRDLIFAAVRELLGRLAERRPLVIVIDDLHWSDADSLALLRDVMRKPDAPPLLLLTTAREGGAVDPWSIAEDAQLLPLAPLSPEHSRELAGTLLARADSPSSADAATIAAEAAGHPFFIDELVRHNVSLGVTETGPTSRR
ncbi:MAG: AAA family ATPase, partial [Polyangiales bacterium]